MNGLAKVLMITLLSVCAGCATCREHPVACSVAAGIVVTSVAISLDARHGHDRQSLRTTEPTNCTVNPGSCE